jgi:mono/diheme cytochrome c family protein
MIDRKARRTFMLGIVVLVAMLATLALVACGGGSTEPTQEPAAPAADGAQLLEQRCSACHSADQPKAQRMTAAEWEQTVSSMITRGAQLTDAEKAVLVEYLAKNYGK